MITLAADVGGTFTDLVLTDPDRGLVLVDKVPTGARGSARGIAPGIERIVRRAGCDVTDIGLFVHGFTVATNAFLMRAGARTVLVTTAGLADVLEIGSQMRPKTYALLQTKPDPVVGRAQVVEVRERVDAFGDVAERLGKEEIRRVAEAVRALGPEAVAISLMFSFAAPDHEKALASAIGILCPGVPVYCSHDINPQLEEWPRASTTAIAAYVGPVVTRYVAELETVLQELGFRGALQLMRSDGGVATPRAARENPAHVLTSGLAGGVTAAVMLCRTLGVGNAITLDVGGTSADLAAIVNGASRSRTSRMIDGHPVRLPTIDVETISNGGGSIAWVDRGGALKVGPQSAGAVPGPACYGKGGEKPTVTDAAVILGWLAPEDYLGGEVGIDPRLAHDAVKRHVADPLKISVEDAAFGIIRVANAMLVQSIRALAVERGLDVRTFSLIGFGGAGPLYSSMIARDLGMREAIVPVYPGVFAAEGLLAADIRHVTQQPFRFPLAELTTGGLGARLQAMRAALAAELDADGVPQGARTFRALGDLRYIGQFHEILVELPDRLCTEYDAGEMARLFHREHESHYGHADAKAAVEIVNLRMEATGRLDVPKTVTAAAGAGTAVPERRRRAVTAQGAPPEDIPVYSRNTIDAGRIIEGPAIITQTDSTTVVLAGQAVSADASGVLRIREVK